MSTTTLRTQLNAVVPAWLAKLEERRGERAALRRAQAQEDLYAVEMAHRLAERLPSVREPDAPFFLAALLAHLAQEPSDASVPTVIERLVREAPHGRLEEGRLKPQRFAQWLHADELPQRLRLFRRVLQLVDRRADAVDLAYMFLTWRENATKRDIARRYFAPRSPHDDADPTAT